MWMTYTIDGFRFEMKRFDEVSRFGIDGGRISKMSVWSDSGAAMVYNYDRGLDFDRIKNTPAGKAAYTHILSLFN